MRGDTFSKQTRPPLIEVYNYLGLIFDTFATIFKKILEKRNMICSENNDFKDVRCSN